jgi:hypothetical protein
VRKLGLYRFEKKAYTFYVKENNKITYFNKANTEFFFVWTHTLLASFFYK